MSAMDTSDHEGKKKRSRGEDEVDLKKKPRTEDNTEEVGDQVIHESPVIVLAPSSHSVSPFLRNHSSSLDHVVTETFTAPSTSVTSQPSTLATSQAARTSAYRMHHPQQQQLPLPQPQPSQPQHQQHQQHQHQPLSLNQFSFESEFRPTTEGHIPKTDPWNSINKEIPLVVAPPPYTPPNHVHPGCKAVHVHRAAICMATGVMFGLMLPLFRALAPFLAQHLGDQAHYLIWGDFITLHLALLGVAMFAHGIATLLDVIFDPPSYGVIAYASFIVLAIALAQRTLTTFESRLVPGGRFFWFVPEVQSKVGVVDLVLCGVSLDLLARNIVGLLQRLAGTGSFYHTLLWTFSGVIYLTAQPYSLFIQGYVAALVSLLVFFSLSCIVTRRDVLILLAGVSIYYLYPLIVDVLPDEWNERVRSLGF